MPNSGSMKPKSGNRLVKIFKYPSLLMFVICAFVLIGANVYATFKNEAVFDASVPQPALDVWFADLNAYHSRFSSFPASLVELEREIWIPARISKGKSSESQLEFGKRMFVFANYAYLYQRDAADESICSVWAIPQGERFKEGYTYYELITPKSVTEWRGAALTVEQMRSIPAVARPTGEDMARLGMFKQKNVTDTKKKGGLFSIFR